MLTWPPRQQPRPVNAPHGGVTGSLPRNHFDLARLSLFFLLLPFLFIVSMAAPSNDSSYPSCPSYNCANITISYPYWKMDSETPAQYCGYEGFGISCSDYGGRETPIVYLGSDSYYVPNISYESKRIVLVDFDVSPVVPLVDCPRVRHNIDWGNLSFHFWGQNVNLSFHFNCTGVPPFSHVIPCLSTPNDMSCVNSLNSEPENFNWTQYSCDEEVVATVFDVFGSTTKALVTEFGSALRQGFELKWGRTEDCEKCEESGGRCGYNNSTREDMCFCSGGTTTTGHCKGSGIDWKIKLLIGIIGILTGVPAIVLMSIIYCTIKSSPNNCVALFKRKTEDEISVEAFIEQYGSLSTKRYTYAEVKKMTKSFQVKLGQGGFGTVFKGKLSDGRLVAVKLLNSSKSSGQEFINEVASIGRTSHVNIVTLLGFCFELRKRALVYEFMPNGSLEKFIHGHVHPTTRGHIGVDKLYEVALGIARGLDYLHRGCNTRILHLDIKPHNILLDEDFCPKIADFGLAKLYSRKESIVSMMEARGTIGYIAPEVFMISFGGVSHKSDVYSYGMLILEMVGGRKNVDAGVGSGHTSEIYFPYWIYNRLKKDEILLDGLTTVEENDYARKMTIVGLCCIQTDPKQRPSINDVIEMLEGSMDALVIPPKPFFSSPPRSPATTSQELNEIHYA